MTTFLFWNLYGRQQKNRTARMDALRASIVRLAVRHGIDVLLLAECGIDEGDLIRSLNAAGVGVYHRPASRSKRIHLFSRLPSELWTDAFNDPITDRLTVQKLAIGPYPGILLVGIHFYDRMSIPSPDGRFEAAQDIAEDIRAVEKEVQHHRTVLVGDLNMNPFEGGMVARRALHALMSKRLAGTIHRLGRRTGYPCFYNPMWSLFGDYLGRPPGSYFYPNTQDTANRFWNIYDQVLVRPELMNNLSHVEILEGDGEASLVTKEGRPRKAVFADHLPLLFRLDF